MNRNIQTRNLGQRTSKAFTLIELLVVIAVIAILAGLLFTALPGIGRKRDISKARAELAEIATAIEAFKAKYGTYPADNQATPRNPASSPLYLELAGMQVIGSTYRSLDGSYSVSSNNVWLVTRATGLVNSSTSLQATDDQPAPISFLKEYKPAQIVTNNLVRLLSCSVNDVAWSYNSSTPTNNTGSYDLWVDLVLGDKTNRISNWAK